MLALAALAVEDGQAPSEPAPRGVEVVVVTASPHARRAADVAGSLNILDAAELRRRGAATLGDTLSHELGISSSSFGPGVGQPVIRGQGGGRVEVLAGGLPVADAAKLSPDHANAVETMLAHRVEVLRGPATLRYGPAAVGGVVNVLTEHKHVEGAAGEFKVLGESNGNASAATARVDIGLGRAWAIRLEGMGRSSGNLEIPGLAVSGEADSANGYVENTDTEAQFSRMGANWHSGDVELLLYASNLASKYGIPPGGHAHEEEEGGEAEEDAPVRIDMDKTTLAGKLEWSGVLDGMTLQLQSTDYSHVELEGAAVGTTYDRQALDMRLEVLQDWGNGWSGALGAQYSDRSLNVTGEEAFLPRHDETLLGIFALGRAELGPVLLDVGARLDQAEVASADPERDFSAVNLGLGLILPLAEGSRLGLTLARTERPPSGEELLALGEHAATDSYDIGDPSLALETATNLEVSYSYDGGSGLSARAAAYSYGYGNYIYQRDTGRRFSASLEAADMEGLAACSNDPADFDGSEEEKDEAPRCLQVAQGGARFAGLEGELGWQVTEGMDLRFWADSVRATLDGGGNVPRIPPGRLGLDWSMRRGPLQLGLGLTHALEQGRAGAEEAATDSYTRLDFYGEYDLGGHIVFVRGRNLGDAEIRDATSFLRDRAPQPGRSLALGYHYRF